MDDETGVFAAELLLERRARQGRDAVPTSSPIELAEPVDETWLDHYAARRLSELLVWVRFDPDRVPAHVERYTVIGGASISEKLELGDGSHARTPWPVASDRASWGSAGAGEATSLDFGRGGHYRRPVRVMLALGGNAMTNADGRARVEDQIAAAEVAMAAVAELIAHDVEVVITHGNGPQVGNLLVKNELAAAVVPPVPLDWCGAPTQATLGFVLMDALDAALAARGIDKRSATVVTRTLVDPNDPGFVEADQADRPLPAGRRGADAGRARRGLAGPWREGVAPGGRLARAARHPRRAGGAGADPGRVRGRRQRRRRDPRRTP